MPSLSAAEASNAQYAPGYIPTAIFIGGTSGIGRAMAEALATQTNGRANIILIGRNKAAADEIIASFPPPPSATVKHEFVSCDAAELKNVHKTCQELLRQLDKINILVVSAGGVGFKRNDTSEGLDTTMVLRYYSRPKFIIELLPLLSKAKAAGEDARVLSILGAGIGPSIDLNEDLGVDNWSIKRAMVETATYNDIMIKALSDKHSELSFTHAYPGFVDTPGSRFNWFFSILTTILKLFIVVNADVCAQYMLYPLLSPDFATGGYWVNNHAEKKAFPAKLTEEVVQKVWEHTLEVIKTQ